MVPSKGYTLLFVASSVATLGEAQAMTPYPKAMIHDIHTHHHPSTPGTAIIQLTPETFSPRPNNFYSVGLHPWDIQDNWRTQMAKLLIMALHPQVLMIGEAGLDKKNGASSIELQMEVFREHIRLSEITSKPLIIHCVKAFDELLTLRRESKATQPWLIHGFRGGIEQWQQLTRSGLLVSIGCHYNADLVKRIPLDQILIESDDNTLLESTYSSISHDLGISIEELEQYVANNAYRLLTCQATR